jgi:hypothetical protein
MSFNLENVHSTSKEVIGLILQQATIAGCCSTFIFFELYYIFLIFDDRLDPIFGIL